MKEWKWVVCISVVVLTVVMSAEFTENRDYVLRLVRADGLETFYLLVGAALGLVLRAPDQEDGMLALSAAITAVISSMLLGAFESVEDYLSWYAAVSLVSIFLMTMLFSIVHLFNALRRKASDRKPQKALGPSFVRRPYPRRR